MEGLDHLLLEVRFQVDQHVATTDQVQAREGGIFRQVVLREDTALADGFVDAEGFPRSINRGKKPLAARGLDAGQSRCRIDA
jgi:hypothetical protein